MPTTNVIRPKRSVIHKIAAVNRGFVTTRELRSAGVCGSTIRAWVDGQRLQPILRGVYHVLFRPDQLDRQDWMVARLLAAGHGAATNRLASLELRGHTRFRAKELDIVVPQRRRILLPDTRIRLASGIDPELVEIVGGFRHMSLAWTIAELGQDLTALQIANVIYSVLYDIPDFDVDSIEEELSLRRHVGCARVREALQLHRSGSAGTRSRTEDEYAAMATAAAPHSELLVNCVTRIDGTDTEVDFWFPKERVRVEVDGGQHRRIHDASTDRVDDARYRASNITVLREWWRDVFTDLGGCRHRLLVALHGGAHRN